MTTEQIRLLITGDNASAKTALKGTEGAMQGLQTTAASLKAALGTIGVSLSATMVVRGLDQMIDRMDNIAKGAQRIGSSAGEFQRLAHAANLSGVEAAGVEKPFRNVVNLATNGGDAGAAPFE